MYANHRNNYNYCLLFISIHDTMMYYLYFSKKQAKINPHIYHTEFTKKIKNTSS